jgi:hypothetical protein
MPMVKTKSGMKAFPYTAKGKMEAKEYAKKTSSKMAAKPMKKAAKRGK